jgi:hypothetical protein
MQSTCHAQAATLPQAHSVATTRHAAHAPDRARPPSMWSESEARRVRGIEG